MTRSARRRPPTPASAASWICSKASPPRQRAALTLRYVHDLPDAAIARALGVRERAPSARCSRAAAPPSASA